ncbi:NAD-dependent epimerase/dehydratase family protein [Hephaestia sp. GCM10023244]|uniref:NAD-dependent epimerase/dehydratase family protein n=1 Tax=unclassified Hephaestia TaxID=2631281 RepID=UPI0020776F79|nr:NAD-dependent epimerase/dehydratase family protein [Hephaestia sp. MAHUQ-44]MCM8729939.1 NAD-dependent epimerase/dehydratase family protein [Hephaestia sp. MAHUQ-44]
MTVLVTGVAGFIGAAVAERLLARGDAVIGIDDFNDYYDPALKRARIARVAAQRGDFTLLEQDFADWEQLEVALTGRPIDRIVHLGAQAGVRYSLVNPHAYARTNLTGHLNLLEIARARNVAHMVYASSSSVYGGNEDFPFRIEDRVDHPVSLYAATKKADELMSESYAHLYRIPLTGLRFFTVYGPWGRPDMAAWIFTSKILRGEPIPVFNNGAMRRDFTYIDDIVAGVLAALDRPPVDDGAVKPGGSVKPHAVYNIGNNQPEELGRFIDVIEQACGRAAVRDYQPMQAGDVTATGADITATTRDFGFLPTIGIEQGIPRFVDWYRHYTGQR